MSATGNNEFDVNCGNMKGWIVMDVLGQSIANHKIIILEVRYDKILIEFNKLYNYMYFAAVKHILL